MLVTLPRAVFPAAPGIPSALFSPDPVRMEFPTVERKSLFFANRFG
jgi:hypothetical protein